MQKPIPSYKENTTTLSQMRENHRSLNALSMYCWISLQRER